MTAELDSRPTPILLWGASGHSLVLADTSRLLGYEPVAIFDNDPQAPNPLPGTPMAVGKEGFRQWLQDRDGPPPVGAVAIGGGASGARLQMQCFLEEQGIQIVDLIHPAAHVAPSASLGAGAQILAQAAVSSGARLERACIVNTGASVDHECHLGNCVHVAPGARLTGNVQVGDNTFIGAGAIILPHVKIGSGVLVGAGAVVTRDVSSGLVVIGSPARPVRRPED